MGDGMLEVKDVSALTLRRPVDHGYVVAWDVQKEIWGRCMGSVRPVLCVRGT